MGWLFEAKVESGEPKQTILFLVGNFSADQYVAEDSSGILKWVIFPEGFHCPENHGTRQAAGLDFKAGYHETQWH